MRFEHPTNGYVETANYPALWCLLFGPVYFAFKGIWTQAAASLLLAIFTGGLSWFVYPFFARRQVQKHYLRQGWHELEPQNEPRVSVWDAANGVDALRR